MMAGGRSVAVSAAAVCAVVLALNCQPTPTVAQFVVRSADSACPTNRYFLSSLDDVQPAYSSLSGVYIGTGDAASESGYRHELGHASLRSYTAENYGTTKRTWYIENSDSAASVKPALPAPGSVVEDDSSSPRGYLRSSSPHGTDWEAWSDGDWERSDVQLPDGDVDAACDSGVRLRCVSAALRCPAGRLHVSGLPVGELTPVTLKGHLLGADQPAFSKERIGDDDPHMTVASPLPPSIDSESDVDLDDNANRVLLGTFLMTKAVHMNRPVYRQAGDGYPTFLYFDRLKTSDSESVPLWIVGQQPSQIDLDKSRLFFVVDSAAKPEEITGCWRYLVGGQQSRAYLNATCEHGRTPPGPLSGADCDFELPGACGYRAIKGQLSQKPYSEDQLSKVWATGDTSPGRFFADVTSPDGGMTDVLSMTFEAATNSCITLDYRMSTDAFFRCQFSLVSETDGAKYIMFTMSSAAREWMRIQRNVTAGRYRLHARTNELAENDHLQMDSVRVTPGSCGKDTSSSPCSRQPCANGGTCVPTGATTYTCLCQGQFHGRNCGRSSPCAPPPKVPHGAGQLVPAPEDTLPVARYSCRPEFQLKAPLARSVAMCLDGQWRGMPECRRENGEAAEVGPGGGAAGRVLSKGLTAAAALAVVAALRAGLW